MLKIVGKKVFTIFAEKFCSSKTMRLFTYLSGFRLVDVRSHSYAVC